MSARTIEHVYSPRGGCKEIFDARDDEVLISGPAGTGKSRACLEKLHMMCLINPGLRALIVRKTLVSLGSSALVTWRTYVIPEALMSGDVVYYGGSREQAAQYRYKNGSTVTIGGMDKPTRIMSTEYDIVYVQEATELTIEDTESITSRLRNWRISFQQLLMDCNPAGEQHWLKLRCNDGKTRLIESRHEDNPRLFNEDGTLTDRGRVYIGKLDRLTGVRLKRLRYGLWVSAEGQIFESYDPAFHILDWTLDDDGNRLPLPEDWPRYWVIDFGFVHPFVCQWWAEGPDGELYRYREIHMTNRTVEEHAKTIMDQVTRIERKTTINHLNGTEHTTETRVWTEPKPVAIICDHDAEDRRTFERHTGLGTQAAIKDVSTGLDLTIARFSPEWRQVGADEYSAGLYFMRDALIERDPELIDAMLPTCTEEEIPNYTWALTPDGRKKEEPKKDQDDGCDCTRYMTMWKDHKGKARATEI